MSGPPRKKRKVITRSRADYFLVGKAASHISGSKLPSVDQVFKFL